MIREVIRDDQLAGGRRVVPWMLQLSQPDVSTRHSKHLSSDGLTDCCWRLLAPDLSRKLCSGLPPEDIPELAKTARCMGYRHCELNPLFDSWPRMTCGTS